MTAPDGAPSTSRDLTEPARCTARAKSTGKRCGNYAIGGAPTCRLHGGKAPQVQAAAKRRQARAEAERFVAKFTSEDAARNPDAHRQLAKLINTSSGFVSFYEAQCAALTPDALVWGDVEARDDARGLTVIQRAEVNLWLRLFNEERRHLAMLCKVAIEVGLAEREVRLAEQHGALIAQVLRDVLSDLELTQEQQARVLTVVPLRLRDYGQNGTDAVRRLLDPPQPGPSN
jgi:hypothetical protein